MDGVMQPFTAKILTVASGNQCTVELYEHGGRFAGSFEWEQLPSPADQVEIESLFNNMLAAMAATFGQPVIRDVIFHGDEKEQLEYVKGFLYPN